MMWTAAKRLHRMCLASKCKTFCLILHEGGTASWMCIEFCHCGLFSIRLEVQFWACNTSYCLACPYQNNAMRRVKRAGSKAFKSTEDLPSAISSAMAYPVHGPFRMPQQVCPADRKSTLSSGHLQASWRSRVRVLPIQAASRAAVKAAIASRAETASAAGHVTVQRDGPHLKLCRLPPRWAPCQ